MTLSIETLEGCIGKISGVTYVEARFHERKILEVRVSKGELDEAKSDQYSGVGVRVLVDGAWGFSSTAQHSTQNIVRALDDATSVAKALSKVKKEKAVLGEAKLARGVFKPVINDPVEAHSFEEKVELVKEMEKRTRSRGELIKSASCAYREILDHKLIVSSDGASAEIFDFKPEFRVTAVASEGGDLITASETEGVTGGWGELFRKKKPEEMADKAAELALKLLKVKPPKGERTTVILDPGMVGLISHEAIGHTVEADFVLSGSIARDKLEQTVASEKVTLVDSGPSLLEQGAAGTVLVDDEGVIAKRTAIIERGALKSYLHNRETAAIFNTYSTGSARAFEYDDEPIIRMRNTYIEPGDYGFEEMVREVDHGYLLKGARGGQADANGEFMFTCQEAYRIEKGEVQELLRGMAVSGQAFDVLKSVDAVGKEFHYDLGSGYCGKGQLAKVDGGGPYLRCKAVIGGIQG